MQTVHVIKVGVSVQTACASVDVTSPQCTESVSELVALTACAFHS